MRNTVSLLIVPVLLAACAWLSRASSTAGGLGEPTPTPSVESIPNPAHTPTLQTSPGSRYAYQVFGVPGVTSPPICDFKKPFDIALLGERIRTLVEEKRANL